MAVKDLNAIEVREGEFVDKTVAVVPGRASEIALEINIIKRKAAEGLLKDAIEIGRLLCEAKEQVPYGEWGPWLEENVSYSVSTANDMMRLYNEQERAAQLDMFGQNGFQMFEGLAPSKVVELIRLPAHERKSFVETHDVSEMSVREIKAEIKAEREAKEKAERRAAELEEAVADANQKAAIAEDARVLLADKLESANQQIEQLQISTGLSPEERAEIENEAKKAAEAAAEKKIEAARKKAEKELEKACAEGADAVKRAEAERESAIKAARAEAKKEAEQAVAAKVAELEDKLRTAAAVASPYRVKFGTCLEALQAAYARMEAVVSEAEREEPEEGALLRQMLAQVVDYLKGA